MLDYLATHRPLLMFLEISVFFLTAPAAAVGVAAAVAQVAPIGVALTSGAAVFLGAVAAVLALVFAVDARTQELLEAELLAKYRVPVTRVQGDVWSINGELRQASVVESKRALLVGGRELEVCATD